VLGVIAVQVLGTCVVVVASSGGSKSKTAGTPTPLGQAASTPTPQAASTRAPAAATPAPAPKFASFGDGAHRVGSDIQPGTYRTRRGSSGCYFARLKGFGGTVSDILANGNSDAPVVVTIQPSDAGFQSNRCGTWTQDLSALGSGSSFGDGDWIVGTDIQPGTYRKSGGAGCYYARLMWAITKSEHF
jgi:hypothetical protein